MNERPDQLGRCIDDRLVEMIRQITDARNAFTSVGQHVNWAVEVKLEQIRTRAAARSSQFQKERERVNSKVKRELANAKEKVEGWKESGQTETNRKIAFVPRRDGPSRDSCQLQSSGPFEKKDDRSKIFCLFRLSKFNRYRNVPMSIQRLNEQLFPDCFI